MHKYFINENFIAKQDQVLFSLNKPFINQYINIYKNGLLLDKTEYNAMQDSGKIIFQNPLNKGDIININSSLNSDNINLEILSPGRADKPNALYKKYGTVERLKYNNDYKINIVLDKEVYNFSFLTQLSPFFTTVRKIHEDIGEFIQGYTDKYISSIIYQNSQKVYNLTQELLEKDIENVTIEKINNNYNTNDRAVKDWVRYKTEIDLIYARYYGISLRYGSHEKSLGDIAIKENIKLPYLDQLLNRLKDQWQEADDKIRGINIVATAVKASNQYSYNNWARTTNF